MIRSNTRNWLNLGRLEHLTFSLAFHAGVTFLETEKSCRVQGMASKGERDSYIVSFWLNDLFTCYMQSLGTFGQLLALIDIFEELVPREKS